MPGFETMDQTSIERCRLVRLVLDKQTAINDLIAILKSA
jgi:hypothetical protein